MATKVFVSHASEDKDRFVLGFAERLRENGVDAWLDKWEMLPGDSLVDKIFDEGIKDAAAIIVVLSESSLSKPWVKEELNAAVVSKINNGSKLIPIVLDDCEVPSVLQSTLWEKISNTSSYDDSFNRVIASIFNVSSKPKLGPVPAFTQPTTKNINGMNDIDSLILKLSCEAAIENGSKHVNPKDLFFKDGMPIIPTEELRDALEIMDQFGSIELHQTIGRDLDSFHVTDSGFELYARDFIYDYEGKIKEIMFALANKQILNNNLIAKEVGTPLLLVNHILDLLEHRGDLQQSKSISGLRRIYKVSPSLRRSLKDE